MDNFGLQGEDLAAWSETDGGNDEGGDEGPEEAKEDDGGNDGSAYYVGAEEEVGDVIVLTENPPYWLCLSASWIRLQPNKLFNGILSFK